MKRLKTRKRAAQLKPRQRKSSSLNLRVLDELKGQLEVASRRSGRTLSEEAAFRLTMSFRDEIQAVKRGLGDVMVEMLDKLGWGVGLEEAKHAVSVWEDQHPRHRALVFIPPEHQQLFKSGTTPLSAGIDESR